MATVPNLSLILIPAQGISSQKRLESGLLSSSLDAATQTNLITPEACAKHVTATMAERLELSHVITRTECAMREVSATTAIAIGTTSSSETRGSTSKRERAKNNPTKLYVEGVKYLTF